MRRILITGKDSYIGTSVENWLKQEPDKYIVDTIDMKDAAWKEINFSRYDAVFHVAGIAHVSSDPKLETLYYKVNRDLAIETAEKAKTDGVRQFLFMSSIIVYGEGGDHGVIREDTVPMPSSFYGDSKLQAEKGILRLASESFRIVILRPPMIYGKASKGNYPRLAKLARTTPVFPDINNARSMIHIDNLCEFVKIMIDQKNSGIFFPQNAGYVKTSEMVRLIAEVHGKRIHMTHVFNWLIKLASLKIELFNKIFGTLIYEQSMSVYEKCDYQIRDLKKSIELSELERNING